MIKRKFKQTIAVFICASLLFSQQVSVFAEMMGDSVETTAGNITRDGSTNTSVDRAQNGVPVVNIAKP
jgi:hypothetical protein